MTLLEALSPQNFQSTLELWGPEQALSRAPPPSSQNQAACSGLVGAEETWEGLPKHPLQPPSPASLNGKNQRLLDKEQTTDMLPN